MSVIAAFAVPHPPIILPEVGRGEERKISATAEAYSAAMARAAALSPDVIVITSPHSIMYSDYIHISPGVGALGDFSRFRAPRLRIEAEYDSELQCALCAACKAAGLSAGTDGERETALDHGTMIPLYFLQKAGCRRPIVRTGLSALSYAEHFRFGQCIAAAAEKTGRRVVLIASGDLSHKLKADGPYGLAPEGAVFDKLVCDSFASGRLRSLTEVSPELAESAAECGLRSFQIMAGALEGREFSHELLSYEGPFGVGYAVAAFEVNGSSEQEKVPDEYVRLARLGVETFVKTGKRAALPKELSKELTERRAGVFVSLKKHGQLRGCIGTISPSTGSIAEEILQNSVYACSEDNRFSPVTVAELGELSYSVDVLMEPERIFSPAELDVKRYGVIVECGRRRGLLLPNLEGVDTPAQQIAISRQKAGILPVEPITLKRFEVVRHK